MIKKLKIFFIKLKWVLFGKKTIKQVKSDIMATKGLKIVHRKSLNTMALKTMHLPKGIRLLNMMEYPKVKIEGIKTTENNYNDGNAIWNCLKLIEHSKKYTVFNMPLAGIDISIYPWSKEMSIDSFIFHAKRIEKTNLKHPIILDDQGCIADGWHRICKAILLNKTTIKAIRLETMPPVDKYIDNEN